MTCPAPTPYSGTRPTDTPEVDVYVERGQLRGFVAGLLDTDEAGALVAADLAGAAVEMEVAGHGRVGRLDRSTADGTLVVVAEDIGEFAGVPAVYVVLTEAEERERRGLDLAYDLRTEHPDADPAERVVYRCRGRLRFNHRQAT